MQTVLLHGDESTLEYRDQVFLSGDFYVHGEDGHGNLIGEFLIDRVEVHDASTMDGFSFKMPKLSFKLPKRFKMPSFKVPKFKAPKLPSFKAPKLPSFKAPKLRMPSSKIPSLPKIKLPNFKVKLPDIGGSVASTVESALRAPFDLTNQLRDTALGTVGDVLGMGTEAIANTAGSVLGSAGQIASDVMSSGFVPPTGYGEEYQYADSGGYADAGYDPYASAAAGSNPLVASASPAGTSQGIWDDITPWDTSNEKSEDNKMMLLLAAAGVGAFLLLRKKKKKGGRK